MNTALYYLVRWGFQYGIWGGDLVDADNLPEHGPAVLVSNHGGALGPIAVGASMPYEMYTWIHADMLDPRLAPEYLRRDFVEPQLHLRPPASEWLAGAISKIHVPLLRAVGGIPVYHTLEGIRETLQITVDRLVEGNVILIFPEDPLGPLDHRYNMRPFQKGFARCGELYFERVRRPLAFCPLAVHAESRTVCAGKPILYNPNSKPASERQRIKSVLEQNIQKMLMEATLEGFGAPEHSVFHRRP